jgi:hypothetical protein
MIASSWVLRTSSLIASSCFLFEYKLALLMKIENQKSEYAIVAVSFHRVLTMIQYGCSAGDIYVR